MNTGMTETHKTSGLWGARVSGAKPAETAPEPNPRVLPLARPGEGESRAYSAFEVRDRATPRLHLRCARSPSRYPSYAYLLDIIADEDFVASFTLVYSFMVVNVTGKNLAPVIHAIAQNQCAGIAEFHPSRHDRPAEGEPVVEGIEVVASSDNGE